MADRCKHDGPPRSVWTALDTPSGMFHRECAKCGAWLSLGPSDESDPRVAIEIAAAFAERSAGFPNIAHKDDHRLDIDSVIEDCDGCQIEHLLECMDWHECFGAKEQPGCGRSAR